MARTATAKPSPRLHRLVRVLLLLSGGIDSPVAGRMLQENGHEVAAIHFSQEPFTDASPEDKSRETAEALGLEALWISQAGERFGALTRECEHRFYFVLSKRLMMRAASLLAQREGYDAIATGENLGQVSSQTLQNLTQVHGAARVPVLTPLLALDKTEIVDLAKEIGTYGISEGPELCDTLGPDHPATGATAEQIAQEEAKIEPETLARSLVAEDNLTVERLATTTPSA